MKTKILNHVLSEKELYYIYRQCITSPSWLVHTTSTEERGFMYAPRLDVKRVNENPNHYPLYMWGQTLVYRIAKLLEQENIGIPTELIRMWFNVTYYGKKTQHWLHPDDDKKTTKSILLFITPIWQPDWRGSFYVDGEEFKFKPGSAVIFDSTEYHQGESPISETYNWQRITCNILTK